MLVSSFVCCLLFVLSIAFFTLFERKVSFVGLSQPLSGGFKLFFGRFSVFSGFCGVVNHFFCCLPWILIAGVFLLFVYFMLFMSCPFLLFFYSRALVAFSILFGRYLFNVGDRFVDDLCVGGLLVFLCLLFGCLCSCRALMHFLVSHLFLFKLVYSVFIFIFLWLRCGFGVASWVLWAFFYSCFFQLVFWGIYLYAGSWGCGCS